MSTLDLETRTRRAAEYRAKAEQLERYAAGCRAEGFVHGAEGAEDAEAAARDYRDAAERLDHGLPAIER